MKILATIRLVRKSRLRRTTNSFWAPTQGPAGVRVDMGRQFGVGGIGAGCLLYETHGPHPLNAFWEHRWGASAGALKTLPSHCQTTMLHLVYCAACSFLAAANMQAHTPAQPALRRPGAALEEYGHSPEAIGEKLTANSAGCGRGAAMGVGARH